MARRVAEVPDVGRATATAKSEAGGSEPGWSIREYSLPLLPGAPRTLRQGGWPGGSERRSSTSKLPGEGGRRSGMFPSGSVVQQGKGGRGKRSRKPFNIQEEMESLTVPVCTSWVCSLTWKRLRNPGRAQDYPWASFP